MIEFNAKLIEGFVKTFLWERFDAPTPIPDFHRRLWEMVTSEDRKVVIAAPRGHGKSTAITLSYALAAMLFKQHDYILIVSDTYQQSVEFLGAVKTELSENEEIVSAFEVADFSKDREDEVIVRFADGHQARFVAKGAEQKVRGIKWNNKRPNLIIIDDLENDELVLNGERRAKLLKWVTNALLPCGTKGCKIRMVGTVLHFDGVLERFLKDSQWTSVRFKAHKDFDDFSEILWPGHLDEKGLREVRQQYLNQGDPDGYSQEYLNNPIADEMGFFKRSWFQDVTPEAKSKSKTYYAAWDFALSTKARADYTVCAVVALDYTGYMQVVDIRRERLDAHEIVLAMMDVQETYKPELTMVEKGGSWCAVKPGLELEMMKRSIFLNIYDINPSKDKMERARPLQQRMRAGGVLFDKEAHWYPMLLEEMTRFPRAQHDDQVDALALVAFVIQKLASGDTPEEEEEAEYQAMKRENPTGRSKVCGY